MMLCNGCICLERLEERIEITNRTIQEDERLRAGVGTL